MGHDNGRGMRLWNLRLVPHVPDVLGLSRWGEAVSGAMLQNFGELRRRQKLRSNNSPVCRKQLSRSDFGAGALEQEMETNDKTTRKKREDYTTAPICSSGRDGELSYISKLKKEPTPTRELAQEFARGWRASDNRQ